MKQYLLFILFVALSYNIGFGQPCVDLSKQKQDLEEVIADMNDNVSDKTKLQQLSVLFKICVTTEELKNIKNTYLNLTFDAPQQQSYKAIIKNILDANKLLCVNFVNIQQGGINKNYLADLEVLLKEYEGLKEKNIKENTYAGTPTENNYNVLNQLKLLLNHCVTGENLKRVEELNNQIITEGFNGGKTNDFKANLKEILRLNSKLFETPVATPVVKDTSKTSEKETIEENVKSEESKSNFWSYFLYLLFGISILANGYFLYEKFIKNKIEEEPEMPLNLEPNPNELTTTFQKEKLKVLEKENKGLIKENDTLKRDLENANDKIQTLENLPKQIEQTIEKEPIVLNKSKKEKKQNNIQHEIQYFAAPNEQGEFMAKNGESEVKLGASIYIFYVNGLDATFEFYNDPSTFQATINDFGNRIKPVCDALNAYNPNATKIETETPGTAFLDGDKWVFKQKAKIKYV